MSSLQEIMQAASEEVAQEVSVSDKEVTNKIEALLKELTGKGSSRKEFRMYSEDELSRISGSLATLKISLGEIMANADTSYRISEDIVKLHAANTREHALEYFKDQNMKYTQGDVSAFVDKRLFSYRLKSSLKEQYSKKIQNLWWSLKSLLEVISKRIEVLQNQRTDSRLSKNDSIEYDLLDN